MKKIILLLSSLSFCCLLNAQTNIFPSTGAAGIGTTIPDPSSLLDIVSTSQGILIPRMTEEQRNAIASPVEGLLIYQTNHTAGFYYYGGVAWRSITSQGWLLKGNKGVDPSNEFIGTTDKEQLMFRVNNQKSGLIDYNNLGNTSFGYQALSKATIGLKNVAIGFQALNSNTSAMENTAAGYQALYSNTFGCCNVALGSETLFYNTEGGSNVAVGCYTLQSNGTGNFNNAIGYQAMYNNYSGSNNTADGYEALVNNNGSFNTANGFAALSSNVAGNYNTGCGWEALEDNTVGLNNTGIGAGALYYNTSGSNNTAIGNNADANFSNYNNSTALGNEAAITTNNQVRIGNGVITSIGGYTDWTNISDARAKKNIKENVPGLAFIHLLKPVTYNYDLDAADKIVWPEGRPALKDHPQPEALQKLDAQAKQEKEQISYTGFLAQDVETAAKSIGYDFSGVDAPKNDKDLYGLRYAEFVVPLVKAVQELDSSQKQEAKSQNNEIDSLKAEIENLKLIVSNLKSAMSGNSKFLQMDSPGKTSNYTLQTANLYQNIPNPFNQQTIIRFNLPSQFSSAQMTISNSAGAVLKNFDLSNGMNQIVLQASEFPAGSYQYSLLIDGKVIDSKQMVLTK